MCYKPATSGSSLLLNKKINQVNTTVRRPHWPFRASYWGRNSTSVFAAGIHPPPTARRGLSCRPEAASCTTVRQLTHRPHRRPSRLRPHRGPEGLNCRLTPEGPPPQVCPEPRRQKKQYAQKNPPIFLCQWFVSQSRALLYS